MLKNVFVATLVWASLGFCQTPGKESSDTLHALLTEVHQLRQAIETMTVASQRVQIALYALQMQDGAVARATQQLDSLRVRCSGAEEGRQRTFAESQRIENSLASGTIPEAETNDLKSRMAELKSALETQTAKAQSCQVAESEASTQLRDDKAKLLDLQDRIAHLDKALEQLGGSPK